MITKLETEPGKRDTWNVETSGQPGINMFSDALQVWSWAQPNSRATVDEAAQAFNVHSDLIRQAVEWHGWMFLAGNVIEHDGD